MKKKILLYVFSLVILIIAAGITGCNESKKSSAGPSAVNQYGQNGYILTPAGAQIGADRKSIPMPSEIALTPDGKTILVLSTGWVATGGGSHQITTIDATTDKIVSHISFTTALGGGHESFDGMAVNSTGTDIYVPGIMNWDGSILDVGIDSSRNMNLKQAIPLQTYTTSTFGSTMTLMPTAAGIAITGNTLISANNVAYDSSHNQYPGETVSIIDLSGVAPTSTVFTGGLYPWAVAIDGTNAYICNRGSGTVSVMSLGSSPSVTTIIPVQVGPAAIIPSLDGSKMYVANTLSDSVSVIDTSTDAVSFTISLAMFNGEPTMGGIPDGLALSGDGKYLYVAMAADEAVAVIDTSNNTVLGRIPAGLYPAGVVFNNSNDHIYVANMYGIGHGPWVPATSANAFDLGHYNWYVYGSVSDITQPTTSQLVSYTTQVLANDFINPGHPPVPKSIQSAWSNIKHVVYILRENKTYDMEFGDYSPQTDAKPIPCPYYSPGSVSALSGLPGEYGCNNFGMGITTPNTHAMAKQFAFGANFYLDIDTSIEGHPLSFQGMISDYLMRISAINTGYGGSYRAEDAGEPIAAVPSGTIFDALHNAGISFSSFGQGIPSLYNGSFNSNNPLNSLPAFDHTYGGLFSDVARADYFVSAFNNMVADDSFPSFVFLTLGDDHYPPGDYSENDYATAEVVQAIANSKYWGSTVIFLDEDDPQVGIDHVDQWRSFIVVVGPYAKHGYISTAHYGFPSILRTIEIIFNLQPMTEYDATALPMYDLFQATPVMTPFTAIPETWPKIASPPSGG